MNFYKKYKWLLPLLGFTTVMLMARMIYTWSVMFAFIPWNLFLAGIPLAFSYLLVKTNDNVVAWCMFGLWLLFFPNAMYIVTDMFHLKENPDTPQWFDLLLLFSAALNGVIIGMLSLYNAEQFLRKNVPVKYVPLIVFSLFLLCGYGIYLGRYLRWNSWDIFTQPLLVLLDIKNDVRHPIRNNQSWMLSTLFATWLYILYKYIKRISAAPKESIV